LNSSFSCSLNGGGFDATSSAPAARALAEESLGMAKGHLDTLREVAQAAAAR